MDNASARPPSTARGRGPDPTNWLGIAADDKMPSVLQRLSTAPVHLRKKDISPDDPLHVAHLAFEDTAPPGIARRKHLTHPDFGIDSVWQVSHTFNLPDQGKERVNARLQRDIVNPFDQTRWIAARLQNTTNCRPFSTT